jgi:hypothetical protein
VSRVLVASLTSIWALASALGLFACEETGPQGPGSTASGSGGAGGCAVGPQPMFTLTLTAADGPLPPDTSILVTWSAGAEPKFVLGDKSTWKTLEEANLVCEIDPSKPPPTDLEELVCKLWTSGPTRVEVEAADYIDHDETFTPAQNEQCEGPVPSAVSVELVREVDAGNP